MAGPNEEPFPFSDLALARIIHERYQPQGLG
jgi:hypothetical protein